jgi:hypothetical protein
MGVRDAREAHPKVVCFNLLLAETRKASSWGSGATIREEDALVG